MAEYYRYQVQKRAREVVGIITEPECTPRVESSVHACMGVRACEAIGDPSIRSCRSKTRQHLFVAEEEDRKQTHHRD